MAFFTLLPSFRFLTISTDGQEKLYVGGMI